ncbi:ATP-dependent DNA helicase [Trichonephila clavipes]|nr:ATP-dependent DNA helicase [Trichonephila clavipes]
MVKVTDSYLACHEFDPSTTEDPPSAVQVKPRNLRNSRSERTEEQIQQQNTDARVRMAQLHQEEPEDTRAERNEVRRLEQQQSRRFTVNRRRTNDQQRQQVHRAFISDSFLRPSIPV